MTGDLPASPHRTGLVGAATAVVAVTLTVLFWPVGLWSWASSVSLQQCGAGAELA